MPHIVLAEYNTGMNWEIAAVKMTRLQSVLDEVKEKEHHDYTVTIDSKDESDGTPYGNKAPHYYLVVRGSKDTSSKLVEGIKQILMMV